MTPPRVFQLQMDIIPLSSDQRGLDKSFQLLHPFQSQLNKIYSYVFIAEL
jgi:hypothetical protein